MQGTIEGAALFVLKGGLAQAAGPVGGVRAGGDGGDALQHAVEFGEAAGMGVGIALDQAAAAQGFDRKVLVLRQVVAVGGEP